MKKPILILFFTIVLYPYINCQTIIKSGDIFGTWNKENSPYIIKGDLNVPFGKTLEIQAGVKIQFEGSYVLNVQGNLIAIGSVNDSISFSVLDTTSYSKDQNIGWNGIHFDKRDIRWDTIKFMMPEEDEELKEIIKERIRNGKLDTTSRVRLRLAGPDLVNDDTYIDKDETKEISKIRFCKFQYTTINNRPRPYIFGGAIYIYRYRNLIISNSKFEYNRAYAGGAIYCKEAAPAIINNTFKFCNSVSSGGALVFIHSGAILIGNMITDNTSGYNGGGILFYESCPFLLNNIILNNICYNTGGGIFSEKQTGPVLEFEDYSLKGNTKTDDYNTNKTDLGKETSKNIDNFNGRFFNNIICNNKARNGAGIGLYAVAPEFTNNTISNNYAQLQGGGIYSFFSAPNFCNSIIYGNKSSVGNQFYLIGRTSLQLTNVNLESDITGIAIDTTCKLDIICANILSSPPLFVDPQKENYSLKKGSPCIDAGSSDTAYVRVTSIDLYGNKRICNSIVDLGAIEFNSMAKVDHKSTIEMDSAVSNHEIIVNLYPNPNDGRFSIVLYNNPFKKIHAYIFNQNGSIIYEEDFYANDYIEHLINLNDKSSGLYVIRLVAEGKNLYQGEFLIK